MPRHVVFLRAINLGATRKVPMAELRELASELGFEDPRTHLQSGNLVVGSSERSAAKVAATLAPALEQRFGFAIPVVVRSRAQLQKVVDANPLADVADDDSRYLVVFCERRVDPGPLTAVEAGDERVAVVGREYYLWCPDGVNASKLWRRAADLGTGRNWRTVTKMLELAR